MRWVSFEGSFSVSSHGPMAAYNQTSLRTSDNLLKKIVRFLQVLPKFPSVRSPFLLSLMRSLESEMGCTKYQRKKMIYQWCFCSIISKEILWQCVLCYKIFSYTTFPFSISFFFILRCRFILVRCVLVPFSYREPYDDGTLSHYRVRCKRLIQYYNILMCLKFSYLRRVHFKGKWLIYIRLPREKIELCHDENPVSSWLV